MSVRCRGCGVEGLEFCVGQNTLNITAVGSKYTFWLPVFGLQVPAVNLVGNVLWFPEQFLLAHLMHMAKLIDKKTQEAVKIRRHAYLQQKAQSVPKEARTFCLQVR
jgi:hypothetical protein